MVTIACVAFYIPATFDEHAKREENIYPYPLQVSSVLLVILDRWQTLVLSEFRPKDDIKFSLTRYHAEFDIKNCTPLNLLTVKEAFGFQCVYLRVCIHHCLLCNGLTQMQQEQSYFI